VRRRAFALQLAYRCLTRRPHTERELEARLHLRGVSDTDIASTLDHLKQRGYLDDAATAARWARSWRIQKGWGPLRVRAELIRRGVRLQVTEPLLAELFPDDDTEAAAMQIAVRLSRRPAFAKASAAGGRGPVRWLAAQLARRGFPDDLALRVADRCCPGRDEDKIDADG
jgi:regulatory protein